MPRSFTIFKLMLCLKLDKYFSCIFYFIFFSIGHYLKQFSLVAPTEKRKHTVCEFFYKLSLSLSLYIYIYILLLQDNQGFNSYRHYCW